MPHEGSSGVPPYRERGSKTPSKSALVWLLARSASYCAMLALSLLWILGLLSMRWDTSSAYPAVSWLFLPVVGGYVTDGFLLAYGGLRSIPFRLLWTLVLPGMQSVIWLPRLRKRFNSDHGFRMHFMFWMLFALFAMIIALMGAAKVQYEKQRSYREVQDVRIVQQRADLL